MEASIIIRPHHHHHHHLELVFDVTVSTSCRQPFDSMRANVLIPGQDWMSSLRSPSTVRYSPLFPTKEHKIGFIYHTTEKLRGQILP